MTRVHNKMNVAVYTSVSVLATAVCLGAGYSTSNDVGETLRNIFKSRLHILVSSEMGVYHFFCDYCMIVVNMAYNLLFLFGKLVQRIFFGNLRDAEIQVCSLLYSPLSSILLYYLIPSISIYYILFPPRSHLTLSFFLPKRPFYLLLTSILELE